MTPRKNAVVLAVGLSQADRTSIVGSAVRRSYDVREISVQAAQSLALIVRQERKAGRTVAGLLVGSALPSRSVKSVLAPANREPFVSGARFIGSPRGAESFLAAIGPAGGGATPGTGTIVRKDTTCRTDTKSGQSQAVGYQRVDTPEVLSASSTPSPASHSLKVDSAKRGSSAWRSAVAWVSDKITAPVETCLGRAVTDSPPGYPSFNVDNADTAAQYEVSVNRTTLIDVTTPMIFPAVANVRASSYSSDLVLRSYCYDDPVVPMPGEGPPGFYCSPQPDNAQCAPVEGGITPGNLPLEFLRTGSRSINPHFMTYSCDPPDDATMTQTIEINSYPKYAVTLKYNGGTGLTQEVVEMHGASITAAGGPDGSLAIGSYDAALTVQPGTWLDDSDGPTWASLPPSEGGMGIPLDDLWFPVDNQAAWGLAAMAHRVVFSCDGCSGPSSTDTVSLEVDNAVTAPQSVVTQVGRSTSSGTDFGTSTNWSNDHTSSTGWNVGGQVGFFGDVPTDTFSGGFSSTSSTSVGFGGGTSTSNSAEASTSFTLSNWATVNTIGQTSKGDPYAQWMTYSTTVPGASGDQAAAAQALPYSSDATQNTGSLLSAPSGYGPPLPGPGACTSKTGGSWKDGLSKGCAPWPWQSTSTQQAVMWNPNCTPYAPFPVPTEPCAPFYGNAASGGDPFSGDAVAELPWGSQMNVNNYQQGYVFGAQVLGDDSAGQPVPVVGTVTPKVLDTYYFYASAIVPQSTGPSDAPDPNYKVLGAYLQVLMQDQQVVSVALQPDLDITLATPSVTHSGSAGVTSLASEFNANGSQVPAGTGEGVYTTSGLSLCAPPVLIPMLWTAGCNTDGYITGPPATYTADPPALTRTDGVPLASKSSSTGQQAYMTVPPFASLTCNKGTWSGDPTSYARQWQSWNPIYSEWQDIAGATGKTFTPTPTNLYPNPAGGQSGYVACNVTATNAKGSSSALTASVQLQGGGS